MEASCRKCGESKPLNRDYFKPDTRYSSGFDVSVCRDCHRTYMRDWNQKRRLERSEGQSSALLYRLYDPCGDLLYVGVTAADLVQRFRMHARIQPWWLDVDCATVEQVDSKETALDLEKSAIIHENPRHNRRTRAGGFEMVPLFPHPLEEAISNDSPAV